MAQRLHGLDLARFLAFSGMVLVNFDIVLRDPEFGAPWLVELLQGRAAALFVVLAGVSFAIGARGRSAKQISRRTLKRSAVLLAVGLANLAIFPADIIHYYAVYFVVALPFLFASTRAVLLACGALLIGQVVAILLFDYDAGWAWESLTYLDLWTVEGALRNLLFNGWHPVLPWVGFLLWGIFLSRFDLGSRKVQGHLIGLGLAVALMVEIASHFLVGAAGPDELSLLFETEPVPPMPLYMIAATGWATAAIGLCLWLCPSERGFAAVLSAGRQTLTLYIAQVILGMGTFEAAGWLMNLSGGAALLTSLSFILTLVTYAWLWQRYISTTGPLEILLRRLSG
ncbi:DUF418 domain-containing protein [Pontivivens insulae]|uniref:Heparan-alpha-glucosaminide N-acetyltransferase catalytic domain-containing protein n=1 Tax=Pontivivens insulae TaxID=1639689 RepID=A0A2R8A8R8_9RHOB|nr:heparan-alpha-glucosaminide N-acetyltransferase domain-containing protein [Pontivivens insulae]RED18647.1 putative membrane protein YeiB [Pontivivens insulae]SPF28545.1 hypothetical protein POI8812_00846 [Pontivivens insulae]